jgi:hypothetical protein
MKRLLILTMVFALGVLGAAAIAAQGGNIDGTAKDSDGKALAAVKVQLRNVDTGALVGSTQSSATGAFSFTGVNPGNYIIEIVDAAGKVIGASSSVAVAAGAAITGVTVAASAAGAIGAAAAAGGAGAFFASTGGILLLAAAGVGVGVGIYAATNDASPSR